MSVKNCDAYIKTMEQCHIKTINNGNVSCNFVLAKSRLTPINKPSLTILRLELEAALIAGRRFKTIVQEIKIPVSNIPL